jgi:hypothetical protein
MSRTVFVGLALIGLAACGGGDKKPAPARGAVHGAAKPVAAHRTKSKAAPSKSKRKTTAARDTAGQRNPLTNH